MVVAPLVSSHRYTRVPCGSHFTARKLSRSTSSLPTAPTTSRSPLMSELRTTACPPVCRLISSPRLRSQTLGVDGVPSTPGPPHVPAITPASLIVANAQPGRDQTGSSVEADHRMPVTVLVVEFGTRA